MLSCFTTGMSQMVTKRTNVTPICSKMILKIHWTLLNFRFHHSNGEHYAIGNQKKVKWVQPYISPLFKFSIKLFGWWYVGCFLLIGSYWSPTLRVTSRIINIVPIYHFNIAIQHKCIASAYIIRRYYKNNDLFFFTHNMGIPGYCHLES